MKTPSHSALSSFLCSAILTSAFIPSGGGAQFAAMGAPAAQAAAQAALNGLRAQGFAVGAELALPAPAAIPVSAAPAAAAPATAAQSPLTPEVMDKMLKYLVTDGVDRETAPLIANALGLSATGQAWSSRQAAMTVGGEVGISHSFSISRGSDQDLLVGHRLPGFLHSFRARRDGTVVAGIVIDLTTYAVTVLDRDQAQPELDSELTLWADSIDHLIAAH